MVCVSSAFAQTDDSSNGARSARYAIDLEIPGAQRALIEKNLDLYRWQTNEQMDDAQLRRLMRLAPAQIRELLSTEGFYTAHINVDLQPGATPPRVKLVIDPGERVRVGEFKLAVTGPFDDGLEKNKARLEKLRADWALPVGAEFRHELWEQAKRRTLQALLVEQFPSATIASSRAAVDVNTHQVTLELSIASGPAYTLGALDITGLQRYPARVITSLNPISPGEPYSQAKLLTLQARLQDSSYFAGVAVSVQTDPMRSADVPVKIDVTENPSKRVGLGIGVSTDVGPRGQIDYRDLDLLDAAWQLSSSLKIDAKRQSISGGLQFPPTETGVRNLISALVERTDIEGEIANKLVLGFMRSRTEGKLESGYGVRYFQENRDILGGASTRSSALVPSKSWTWRDVDSLLYPTQGYLFNLQFDGAAKAIISDKDFLRTYTRGTYYLPAGERGQIIARAELGVVASDGRSGIPSDLLFRTGGDQTVRGYAYQSLGVRQDGATVGGRVLGVVSLEYVHWFHPKWGAAAFVDSGNAADSFSDFQPAQGYGLGARWKSPVGPLNFDMAYGERTRAVRLHFSVGLAF